MEHSVIVIDSHFPGLNPMQFGSEECEPGHFFGPAVRTYWLLHYVASGKGAFSRAGVTHHLQAGDIFVIPPYLETFYEADSKQPWRYIWVGFTLDESPLAADMQKLLQNPVIRCPGVGTIFEDMQRCRAMENGRSAFLSSRLWELMSLLQEQGKPVADYIDKALNCMHSEYMTGIGVQEIADRLNLDRSYFSSLFKERMGIAPRDYLIRLRLEKAAELMVVHGERPSTAGASVGYVDLYHFSKVFKQHFGLSPRAYVLKCTNKKDFDTKSSI